MNTPAARTWVVLAAVFLGMTLVQTAAHAAPPGPGKLKEYKLRKGAAPRYITPASDGNLWFTGQGPLNAQFDRPGQVSRITQAGAVTEFNVCNFCSTNEVVEGPGGILYISTNDPNLGRITTSGVLLDPIPLPGSSTIAFGGLDADETSVWFNDRTNNRIVRYDVFAETFEFFPVPTPGANLFDLKVASDGMVWFTESNDGPFANIGRLDPSTGTITEFPVSVRPRSIAIAPDGEVWFTEVFADAIGRLSPATGTVVHFSTGAGTFPEDIVAGADGNLWFTQSGAGNIARISPTGVITVTKSVKGSGPLGITIGQNGDPWYAENAKDAIARVILP